MHTNSFTAGADYRMYVAHNWIQRRLRGHHRFAFQPAGDIRHSAYCRHRRTFLMMRARDLFHPSTFPLTMIFVGACFRGRRDPETETNDEVPPTSAAFRRLRGRVSGSAAAKPDSFAITVDGSNTIGVIVPLIWNAAYRYA